MSREIVLRRRYYLFLLVALRLSHPMKSLAGDEKSAVSVPLAAISLRTVDGRRQEVDLPTVLKLARENNLTVAQARERAKEKRAEFAGAEAEMLPNVKFDAGIGRTLGNISNIGEIPNARATLFLNPARSYFAAKAAGDLAHASEADLQGITQDSLLTAVLQYYDLLRAEAQTQNAEKAVEMVKRLVTTTEALHHQGLAIRADELRARTELADKEQHRLEAQRDFRVASIALATTLNLDPAVTLVPSDKEIRQRTLADINVATEQLTSHALSKRPELLSASQRLHASRQQRKAAEFGQLLPGLGVEHWFGGFAGSRSDFYFVEWNILDQLGGLLSSRRRAERARVKQALLQREQVSHRLAAEVLTARERALTAEEQIKTSQQAVTQAEETLRVSEDRLREVVGVYKDAGITVLEVLQAQEALARARRNLVNALVDYNQAQAGLVYALGDIPLARGSEAD